MGSRYKLPEPGGPKGAHASTMLPVFSCLSLQGHHMSIVQINPFIPSPSHSTTENQSFRFSVKIYGLSALLLPGLELALGGYIGPV